MSERFFSSLPRSLAYKDLLLQTGPECHLQNGGFLAEGLGLGCKVLCLNDEFSGKTVSIMHMDKFIGRKLCVANAKQIVDLLLQHKKDVFDKKYSADTTIDAHFKIH